MKEISQQDMKELFDTTLVEDRADGVKYGPGSLHRRRIMKRFLKNISFDSVIEIGCGNGYFLKYLLEDLNLDASKVRVAGIDIAPKAVEVAKKVLKGDFYALDITEGVPESKYDLIICSETLEHIYDYKSALRNMAKICSGYIIISTPCGPRGDNKASMIRYYPQKSLEADLQEAGFAVIKSMQWGFPFFTPIHLAMVHSQSLEQNPLRTGKFGIVKRILSKILYFLFFLNIPNTGERIFVLAKKQDAEHDTQ